MHTQSMSHSAQPLHESALFSLRGAGHCSKEMRSGGEGGCTHRLQTGPVDPCMGQCTHTHI